MIRHNVQFTTDGRRNSDIWDSLAGDFVHLGNEYGEVKGAIIEFEPCSYALPFERPMILRSGMVVNGNFNTVVGRFEFAKDRQGLVADVHVDKVVMFCPEQESWSAFSIPAHDLGPENFGVTGSQFENIYLTGYRHGFDFRGGMPLSNEIKVKSQAPRGEIVFIDYGGTNMIRVINEGAHYPLVTGSLIHCTGGANYIDGCVLEGFGDREGPVAYTVAGHGTRFTRNYAEMFSQNYVYIFGKSQDLKIDGFNVSGAKIRFQNECFASVGCLMLDSDSFEKTVSVDLTSRVFIEEVKAFGRPTIPMLGKNVALGRIIAMQRNEIWTPGLGWRKL